MQLTVVPIHAGRSATGHNGAAGAMPGTDRRTHAGGNQGSHGLTVGLFHATVFQRLQNRGHQRRRGACTQRAALHIAAGKPQGSPRQCVQHNARCAAFGPGGLGRTVDVFAVFLLVGKTPDFIEDIAGRCIGHDPYRRAAGSAAQPGRNQPGRNVSHQFLVATHLPAQRLGIRRLVRLGRSPRRWRARAGLVFCLLPKLLGFIRLGFGHRTDHTAGQLRRALDQVDALLHGLFIWALELLVGIGGVAVQPH